MKLKEKIKESTVLKLALALIVPGGLIVWGIYEFGRRNEHKIRSNDKDGKNS